MWDMNVITRATTTYPNDDRRAILDLLAAGKITADEAERLLTALDHRPEPSTLRPMMPS